VLTFQERSTGTFQPLRQRLAAEHSPVRALGADYLAYCLIDSIVDREFLLIERMSDDAESLEELVLKEAPRTRTLHEIHRLKRDVIALRRAIWPLRETLHILQRSASGLFGSGTMPYLRDVYDHSVHVIESLEGLRDLLTGTLDVYLSTISNRVNREVRTLTVIATMFMPASVVAGIFGMNFKSMPWIDLPQGFWLALTVMGSIATAMLVAFLVRKFR
jgi:magnesium transporter